MLHGTIVANINPREWIPSVAHGERQRVPLLIERKTNMATRCGQIMMDRCQRVRPPSRRFPGSATQPDMLADAGFGDRPQLHVRPAGFPVIDKCHVAAINADPTEQAGQQERDSDRAPFADEDHVHGVSPTPVASPKIRRKLDRRLLRPGVTPFRQHEGDGQNERDRRQEDEGGDR